MLYEVITLREKYKNDGAEQVLIDREKISGTGIRLLEGDFAVIKNNYVRHNHQKLAKTVMELATDSALAKNCKRAIDYYYLKDRLKKSAKRSSNSSLEEFRKEGNEL